MDSRRVAVGLLLATLVGTTVAGSAAGSAAPNPVCGSCGNAFERAATDVGVRLTVAESTVDVRLHENGTATWVVRTRLANGSGRLSEDPAAFERLVRRVASPNNVRARTTVLSWELRNDTVVLRYRDTDAADWRNGVLVADFLRVNGRTEPLEANADRFSVHAPRGMVVTNDPASGRVNGTTVTWHGDSEASFTRAHHIEGGPYLAYRSADAPASDLRTRVALARETLPLVLDVAVGVLTYPFLVYASGVVALVAVLRRRAVDLSPRFLGNATLTLGLLGFLAGVSFVGNDSLTAPGLLLVLVGAGTLPARGRAAFVTPRRQVLGAGVALLGVFALVAASTALEAPGESVAMAFRATAVALPVAVLLPLGGLLAGDGLLETGAATGATVGTFFAAPPVFVDLATRPVGLGWLFVNVGVLLLAFALLLFGTPLLLLGAVLVDDGGENGGG